MLSTLQQESFIVGAALVAIYQAAKFSQLNVGDPVTSRYIALLPGAKVRDFAGPYTYHLAMAAFVGVSLLAYFLFCHVSPEILGGAAKLFGAPDASAIMKDVPYPLYIAALFMGLTQPIIPVLSNLGDAQRNFFHDRIAVPRRVIDVSESLINAIESRSGTSKRRLAAELRKLTGNEFLTSLQSYGDVPFYKKQLEQLDLDDESALNKTIKDSSPKVLRMLIERLVLTALVAVMRRSGPKSLIKVAECLGAPYSKTSFRQMKFLIAGFIASGAMFSVGLLIIASLLSFLASPVAKFFEKSLADSFWSGDPSDIGLELWAIVPPIFVCLVVAISVLVPARQAPARRFVHEPETSRLAGFIEFFRSGAGVFGACFVVSLLMKFGYLFYDYQTGSMPPEARSAPRLMLPIIQSFIPLVVCVFTTWYLVSGASNVRRGLSFMSTLLAVAAATGVIAALFSLTFVHEYLRTHPDLSHAWESVLFAVVANSLVASCAFACVALFFRTRRELPEAARARNGRHRDASSRPANRTRAAAASAVNGRVRGWPGSGRRSQR